MVEGSNERTVAVYFLFLAHQGTDAEGEGVADAGMRVFCDFAGVVLNPETGEPVRILEGEPAEPTP